MTDEVSFDKESQVMMRIACAVFVACGVNSVSIAAALAQGLLFYQVVVVQPGPALPLTYGIDNGGGFMFGTLTDDDGDGRIELPQVPFPARLALGIPDAAGGVVNNVFTPWTYDTWPTVYNQSQIGLPGGLLGVDFSELTAPPPSLTPGQQITVVDGVLSEWPGVRVVDTTNVPDLPTFIRELETLRGFTGQVTVSEITVQFRLVPEPHSMLLFASAVPLAVRTRRNCPTRR
jgi:hypothetical protein